ncbi:SCO1664 family protein [Gordonia crocea]|uniref:Putative phosphatidylinositol 3-and 4-kinase n=1 Tax=Gordonia crocea TaxID=589162 RepID=A0A7I9UY49_9ACTN|nr:SCO1664 family protein [Gordonia crocea]GED98127.1 putative phosphatidylinositol 3-and 4-kinase [Gordonia crocea]
MDGTGANGVAQVLAHGDLEILGRIPHASNVTLVALVRGADGTEFRCVYKPVSGEAPLWDFPDGTLAGREVAAYVVCADLGWDTVPDTVFRDDGPLGPGMVQRWVDIADEPDPVAPDLVDLCGPDSVVAGYLPILTGFDPRGDEVVLVHADDPRLQRMAVLDIVLNNADRKGGHILAGSDGVVYGIDHGICLHVEDKLRTVLWGWAGRPAPGGLVVDVDGFAERLADPDGELATTLGALITPDEIAALLTRARRLVDDPVLPVPPDHRPIPWPPF